MLLLLISSAVLCAVCHAGPNSVTWTQLTEAKEAWREGREVETAWSNFKKYHGKSYLSAEEEAMRKSIFVENLKKIEDHNKLHAKSLSSFTMGVNQFADLTVEEFSTTMNTLRIRPNTNVAARKLSPNVKDNFPLEVDWRMKGYVTPVKNQGRCGSCWAFSAIGAVEAQHFRKTGSLVSLSEQNLVDCSSSYGNHGCQGGFMSNAFRYIIANGIDTAASYPYNGTNLTCSFKKAFVGANISTYVDVIPSGDEMKLLEAVATEGPVSVGIDASQTSFQFYKSGIYNEPKCSSSRLNHGVLAVGYGYDSQDYWLVKNSWGATWGDMGYIFMSRGKNNQCGIASAASFPL